MFESFARVKKTKSRWKAPMLACGALVHTAIFTGMWINGVWQIKKVDAAENELTLSIPAPIPSVERPANASKAPPTPQPRRVARDTTQPTKVDVKVEPTVTTGDPDAPTGPEDPDAVPLDGNPPPVLPPPPAIPDIKPPPPPPKQQNVSPQVLEQQRVAGDKRILPDDDTAQQIARSGSGEARGVVKLCLDSAGQVRSATIAKSTSFPAYDAKLQREMQGWRYRPYQLDGVATPVCTMVTFIYRQR